MKGSSFYNNSLELRFLSLPIISSVKLTPTFFSLNELEDIIPLGFIVSLDQDYTSGTLFIVENVNSSSLENYLNTTVDPLELIGLRETQEISQLTVQIDLNAPRKSEIHNTLLFRFDWVYRSLSFSLIYFSASITFIYGANNYQNYYIPFVTPPYFSTSISFAVMITWIFGVFMSRRQLKNNKRLFEVISKVVTSNTGQRYLEILLKVDAQSEMSLSLHIRRITTLLMFWMAVSLLIILGLQTTTTVFEFWLLNDVLFEILNVGLGAFLILIILYFLWVRPKPRASTLDRIRQMMQGMILRDLVTKTITEADYLAIKKETDLLRRLEGISELNDDFNSRKNS